MRLDIVLNYLRPESQWSLDGNSCNGLIWHDDDTPPTLEECETAWEIIKADYYMRPVRQQRNELLVASDWTQVADALVDKAAWAVYRQALRDLPENTIDPENPVWPTPPE